MSTIVFLHAHPDDEASQTAGMMFCAARAGHRVIEVIATDGALGTPPASSGAPAADIIAHRRSEAEASADVLGIEQIYWLGYQDSGMLGWESNNAPGCLWQAPVEEVTEKLLAVLTEVQADMLIGYDHHGLYGHPDHVRVHDVSVAAAQRSPRPLRLLFETAESTINAQLAQDPEILAVLRQEAPDLAAALSELDPEMLNLGSDGQAIGLAAADIRWQLELPPAAIAAKRRAMRCHASQTSDIGFMLALPEAVFARRFGVEFLTEPSYLDAPGTLGPPEVVQGWPW